MNIKVLPTAAVAPEAFQDWYGENHPMSRPDDRARREAAERRGGGVWGGVP